ncbi:MAG: nucleoside triphosphate pyrophosphatase [Oligoflexales bacterium]
MKKNWILASTSPRRKELLLTICESFKICSPDFEEKWRGEEPKDYVLGNAVGKGRSIDIQENDVLVSADTIVVLDQKILEKPKTPQHAIEMLKELSGKTHNVMTGFFVRTQSSEYSQVVVTEVEFREISQKEIEVYVATGEPMDKAGSYGIQGRASSMVAQIRGSYTNVMGLPLAELIKVTDLGLGLS